MGRKRRIEDADLLAVAREQFVKEGFGASTRTIAQLAGVSETVLFQRFNTKAELFFAAMVPPAPDLHAILVSRSPTEEPSLRIADIAVRVLEYFREITPVLLPLIAQPGFSYESFIERYPEAPLNQLVGGLQNWLGMLERDGAIVPGTANSVALAVVSSTASLAFFERMGVHGGSVEEEMVRQVARLIWRGAAAAGH